MKAKIAVDRDCFSDVLDVSIYTSTIPYVDVIKTLALTRVDSPQMLRTSSASTAANVLKMPDQDSWDLPYYTLYESTTPKMLYSDDFFGGVCYATRDDSWSKFYQVHEREGKEVIADRFQEGKNSQLKTFMQHAEGGAIYSSFRDAAGDITKAAGKIFVRVKDGSKIVFASGFWLEGDLFVTCSHFYANHYVTDPQKKEAEEHLKNDQFPDYWNTYVDSSTVAHDYGELEM